MSSTSERSSVVGRLLTSVTRCVRSHGGGLLALCLGTVFGAQHLLDTGEALKLAGGLYLIGVLLFVVLFRNERMEPAQKTPAGGRPRLRWWLVAVSAVFGGLAFPQFSGNLFSPGGTALWVLGLILLGTAAWSPRDEAGTDEEDVPSKRRFDRRGVTVTWTHAALLGIMLIGMFYRFYKIDLIPLEMGCDPPHIYNNIRLILRREFLIFFPSHPGREGLFFYLAAPFCRVFGLNHTTIKMASGLIGVMTLPAIYLLGKELFNREVGLYAAFFLSISHWHVITTRVGLRFCTLPLVLVLMWYFLVRALKAQRRWFYALAGVALGVGFYTYNAFLVVPLMVVSILLISLITERGRVLRPRWENVLLLALSAAYVLIPLMRYVSEDPKMYIYRVATRVTSLEVAPPTDLLTTFLSNVGKAFLMFNYRGDGGWAFNVPFSRQLGFSVAGFLVLGLAYLVWRWREGHNATVPLALIVMLLPSILSLAFPHEVPNAGRAIGALPAAMILPAVSLALTRRRVAQILASRPARKLRVALSVGDKPAVELSLGGGVLCRYAGVAALAAIFVFEAAVAYPLYFRDWVNGLPDKNYSISLGIARAIDDFADDGEAYVKGFPYWYDGNAIRAQLRRTDQSWHNEIDALPPDRLPLAGPPGKFMVIVHPEDEGALQTLRRAFPRGVALSHSNPEGQVRFITFYGER